MRNIEVSDEVFGRLQAMAEPFVDTPNTVIARLLDLSVSSVNGRAARPRGTGPEARGEAAGSVREEQAYTFKRPTAFVLWGQRYEDVSSFKDVYLRVCAEVARKHPGDFNKAFLLRGRERMYFNASGEGMTHPQRVSGTSVFAETNFSAQNIVDRCLDVLKLFGYSSDDLQLELRPIGAQ